MSKPKKLDPAGRAEKLTAKIKRLERLAKKADDGTATRLAKKRVKRAQRTQAKLRVEAAGGLTAVKKAAKAQE